MAEKQRNARGSAERSKSKKNKKAKISGDYLECEFSKQAMLCLTKPSYTLTHGGCENIQEEHCIRLRELLRKLMKAQNWVEASGVLSVYMKATSKDRSPENNRYKYSVAMELCRHVETDEASYSKSIESLYSSWMGKIRSWKNKPLKDKSAKLESILSVVSLTTKALRSAAPADELRLLRKLRDACEDARSLTLIPEYANDPKSNLAIGLVFYEDWYFTIPKEMQLKSVDEWCMRSEPKTNDFDSCDDSASFSETHSNLKNHSEASVANYGHANGSFVHCQGGASSGFYGKETDENDTCVEDPYENMQFPSVFDVHGLESLMPIKLPSSKEDIEHLFPSYRSSLDGSYKTALKHLRFALNSEPPASEGALMPLIQLLLLGDQTKEAFIVLDKHCCNSRSILSFRIRAHLWECFHPNDSDKLPKYLEDVLRIDPTCTDSVGRLVSFHRKGHYALERLVEVIASHLEASYPDYNIWREFASCLLNLSQCEEDTTSTCMNTDKVGSKHKDVSFRRIPPIFWRGTSGKTWKLRSKWWLNRHFGNRNLASEIAAGDLQLITNKAACAAHLFGEEFDYVVKVSTYLNEHDKTLLPFLHLHLENSIGFCSGFLKK